jgi:hypothetical protein
MMKRANEWLTLKFAQYSALTKGGKVFIWVFGFLVLLTVELLIAGILYENHVPLYNGWTGQYSVKP